jgi:hypothetical protein
MYSKYFQVIVFFNKERMNEGSRTCSTAVPLLPLLPLSLFDDRQNTLNTHANQLSSWQREK